MKVLVIGKGGREHAIAHAVSRSSKVTAVYAAPGNPGMKSIATNVNISDSDVEGLVAFAKENQIDLTIVGPEHTLSLGVVDAFQKEGLKIFGPTKAAAQVESSKDFAKRIMMRHGIPTAAYATFDDKDAAVCYVKEKGAPIVVKEDGLKAGKGVTVAHTVEEALDALDIAFAQEGNKVVIEECLTGFEFSLICFVCGDVVVPMRRITPQIIEETMNTIMKPMAKAMVEEGVPFTGFLYGGLMLTDDGVKTIEFNARFGDPEAEVILPRLKSDFVEIIETVMDHEECTPEWSDEVTLGVVLASAGYPASSTKGAVIEGLDQVDALVYHMGTAEAEGKLVTAGGRVLIIVAQAPTLEDAYAKAYAEVAKVRCDCLFHRNDIGKKDMH